MYNIIIIIKILIFLAIRAYFTIYLFFSFFVFSYLHECIVIVPVTLSYSNSICRQVPRLDELDVLSQQMHSVCVCVMNDSSGILCGLQMISRNQFDFTCIFCRRSIDSAKYKSNFISENTRINLSYLRRFISLVNKPKEYQSKNNTSWLRLGSLLRANS